MINWIKKILGITAIETSLNMAHKDLNRAFNRIERIEKITRIGRRSMRYDEIERARKRRYKNWPRKQAN